VDGSSFGDEGKNGQGVGVFSTNQPANLAIFSLERLKCVATPSGVHESLARGRHQFLVLPQNLSIRVDEQLAVVHRAECAGPLLA
jgi:hypothetical protein